MSAPFPENPPEQFAADDSHIPYNREAEEAVIGCVLIDPELYGNLRDTLSPADFYIHRLRYIWEAFERLRDSNMAIDVLTACEELSSMGRLDEIGGCSYLTVLLGNVPTTLHAESYARAVKEHSAARKVLTVCNLGATLVHDGKPVSEIVTNMSAHLTEIGLATGDGWHGLVNAHDSVQSADRQAERRSSKDTRHLMSGLADVDATLEGLDESNMYLVAGRPGNGKTSLLLTILLNACLDGFRVLFFSLEMSKEQLVYRLLSMLIWVKFGRAVDNSRIAKGKLDEDEWPLYCAAVEQLSALDFYIDDTPSLTPAQVRLRSRRVQQDNGVDLILLDYLQLMLPEGKKQNREQEVSFVSRSLKSIARELNVPLVAASQMSREFDKRSESVPVLSDLRDSGSLEQDSDVVVFVYQEKDQVGNIKAFKIAKNRHGKVGGGHLYFRANVCRFENAQSRIVSEKI